MSWIIALRLRTQLMLLIGVATGTALLISGSMFVFSDYQAGRAALIKRLTIQATITARSSAAALAFDDVSTATKTLESLKADAAILQVTVLRTDGSLFAQHSFEGNPARLAHVVDVSADILLPQPIGILQLRASTVELYSTLNRQILILSLVMVATLLLTLGASVWLQRIVSEPIAALADAAARVAASRDFGFRVTAVGSQELGNLVTAFNQMLTDLQSGADQLASYQTGLEQEVAARTAELDSALKVAQKAALAKAEFLANMSHEIRTPMSGVIGMLDLLYDKDLPGESKSMLEIARSSADSMLVLINDILDYSKIDAGKLILEQVEFELRPLVEDVASLFTPQALEKGVEVICGIHSGVPQYVSGDPTRLRQIMANLVGNAVKFTQKGEVLLGVRLRSDPSADQEILQIVVRDTGMGMTEKTLGTLFTEFTQADSSTTRKYGGTGLGLAISKKLIDTMSGSVRVKSSIGSGTTFSVHIPLTRATADVESAKRPLAGLKCLIVDDNETNRCVLEHYLETEAIAFHSVGSASAGLQELRRAASGGLAYDCVLLDYQMPEMDGMAFVREVSKETAIAATRCIMLSTLGARVIEADDVGIGAWLSKPVRIAMLRRAVGQATGREKVVDALLVEHRQTFNPSSRVLLVEDNLVNQMVGKRMLRSLGITADVAENGAVALSAIQQGRFDVVLMDCQMPVMDGFAATAAVRSWEAGGSIANGGPRVPIVAMTANALSGDRERCLAAGMDDYLSKPIKRDVLAAILGRWLEQAPLAPARLESQAALIGTP